MQKKSVTSERGEGNFITHLSFSHMALLLHSCCWPARTHTPTFFFVTFAKCFTITTSTPWFCKEAFPPWSAPANWGRGKTADDALFGRRALRSGVRTHYYKEEEEEEKLVPRVVGQVAIYASMSVYLCGNAAYIWEIHSLTLEEEECSLSLFFWRDVERHATSWFHDIFKPCWFNIFLPCKKKVNFCFLLLFFCGINASFSRTQFWAPSFSRLKLGVFFWEFECKFEEVENDGSVALSLSGRHL